MLLLIIISVNNHKLFEPEIYKKVTNYHYDYHKDLQKAIFNANYFLINNNIYITCNIYKLLLSIKKQV